MWKIIAYLTGTVAVVISVIGYFMWFGLVGAAGGLCLLPIAPILYPFIIVALTGRVPWLYILLLGISIFAGVMHGATIKREPTLQNPADPWDGL